MPVNKQILARGLTEKTLLSAVNEELIPVARSLREIANRATVEPPELAIDAGSLEIDWVASRNYVLVLSENVTSVEFADPADHGWHVLIVQQSAAFTVSGWPSSVAWFGGGTAPTITATADRVDMIELFWDGATYYGRVTQNAV